MISGRRAILAELYYKSGSVSFEPRRLSAHQTDPDLPLSPFYLHYPEHGRRALLLPALHHLVGRLFYEDAREKELTFDRIGAVPKGAQPLARAHARRYDGYPDNLITFQKAVVEDENEYDVDDGILNNRTTLLVNEDHTSGGHNAVRFLDVVRWYGATVTDYQIVVDRQQGGRERLAAAGVQMHGLITATELLDYYVHVEHIDMATADRCMTYIADNQLWAPTAGGAVDIR